MKDHRKIFDMGSPLAVELKHVVAAGSEKEHKRILDVSYDTDYHRNLIVPRGTTTVGTRRTTGGSVACRS